MAWPVPLLPETVDGRYHDCGKRGGCIPITEDGAELLECWPCHWRDYSDPWLVSWQPPIAPSPNAAPRYDTDPEADGAGRKNRRNKSLARYRQR